MIFSLIIKNRIPLSQNSRHRIDSLTGLSLFDEYKKFLQYELGKSKWAPINREVINLYGKVFYIHKRNDYYFYHRDADNISKPLWDALNEFAYDDDEQIRHREAAKLESIDKDFIRINVTKIDDDDYEQLIDFCLDHTNIDDQLLYIEIGEFNHSRVCFGK